MSHFPAITPLAEGLSGSTFRAQLNAIVDQLAFNFEAIVPYLVDTNDAMIGRGIVAGSYTPALVTAGTGLSVNVGAHQAMIGYVITSNAAVVAVPASSTTYLWQYQAGALETTPSNVNPGTSDNPAIGLAIIVTSGSAVTSVTETFTAVSRGVTSVAGTAPVAAATVSHAVTVSMHVADGTHDGYLSSADWVTFSGKLSSYTETSTLDDVSDRNNTTTNALNFGGGTVTGTVNCRSLIPDGTVTYDLGDTSHYFGYGFIGVTRTSLLRITGGDSLTTTPLEVYGGTGANPDAWINAPENLTIQAGVSKYINLNAGIIALVGDVQITGKVSMGTAGIVAGSGNPNGSVIGSPGMLYLNQSGGAGTTLYVKESGVGTNTGWVAK